MSRPNNIRIYHQDEHLVVIEKPAGFQVHTPEHLLARGQTVRRNNVSLLLKKQLDRDVFTVHRLDGATSGVMVFALSSKIAASMQKKFQAKEVKKTYVCLVRGWVDEEGIIDAPLTTGLREGSLVEAITEYERIHYFDLPISTGRYPSERYSLVKVRPMTGKMHQIRRHFKKQSHPLIGDTIYGDGKHNRLWRELIDPKNPASRCLFLKAYSLEFQHPVDGSPMRFTTRWNRPWHRLFEILNFCPLI